jgi:hypothetical protein
MKNNKFFALFLLLTILVSKIGTDSTIRTPAEAMEFSVFFGAAMD